MLPHDGVELRRFLLDPAYWLPRIEQLEAVPRRLLVVPRPDRSRPGIEVFEIRLRAHDEARLHGFLARPAFGSSAAAVRLRACEHQETPELCWTSIEDGTADVVFRFPPARKLEDRVLDVLRVVGTIATIEGFGTSHLRLAPEEAQDSELSDAFRIALLIREKGWI